MITEFQVKDLIYVIRVHVKQPGYIQVTKYLSIIVPVLRQLHKQANKTYFCGSSVDICRPNQARHSSQNKKLAINYEWFLVLTFCNSTKAAQHKSATLYLGNK